MGVPLVNGAMPSAVSQTSMEYTSSRSTFIMDVNSQVSMNVSFISAITPNDLKRQSIIGTYLSVSVVSTDGNTHDVQVYADTSAGMSI